MATTKSTAGQAPSCPTSGTPQAQSGCFLGAFFRSLLGHRRTRTESASSALSQPIAPPTTAAVEGTPCTTSPNLVVLDVSDSRPKLHISTSASPSSHATSGTDGVASSDSGDGASGCGEPAADEGADCAELGDCLSPLPASGRRACRRSRFSRHRDSMQLSASQVQSATRGMRVSTSSADGAAAPTTGAGAGAGVGAGAGAGVEPLASPTSTGSASDADHPNSEAPAAEHGHLSDDVSMEAPAVVVLEPHHHDHAPAKSILKVKHCERHVCRLRWTAEEFEAPPSPPDMERVPSTVSSTRSCASNVSFADDHGHTLCRVVVCANLQYSKHKKKLHLFGWFS